MKILNNDNDEPIEAVVNFDCDGCSELAIKMINVLDRFGQKCVLVLCKEHLDEYNKSLAS